MASLNLLETTRKVETTMPFVLYRLVICLTAAFAGLFFVLFGIGVTTPLNSLLAKSGGSANLGAFLGIFAFIYLMRKFKGLLFFNIQAGQLALLTDIAAGGKPPEGKAQLDAAKAKAAQTFPSIADFVQAQDATKKVLTALPARHCPWLSKLPNPQLAEHLGFLAGWLTGFAALPMLSLAFKAETGNPWKAVRAGLIAHISHFESQSKNLFILLAFQALGFALLFLAALYPVDSVLALLPVKVGIWRELFGLILAWAVKAALLDPIVIGALVEVNHRLIAEPASDEEEWLKKLEAASPDFQEIQQKADN